MKHNFITGFISGAVIFGTAGVLAVSYTATPNQFPVKLNGNNIQLEGYNIEGSTFFKLRDISNEIGEFTVDFYNNEILLSKNGFLYEGTDLENARRYVAGLAEFETAALIYEDDEYWYFAPCDTDMVNSMKDSGGHVSPATIVYQVDKASGHGEIINNMSETTSLPEPSAVPDAVPTITPEEEKLSRKPLSEVIEGRWQYNTSSMDEYYIISFSKGEYEDFAFKHIGGRLVLGVYAMDGNTIEITFYEDITRTKVSEVVTFNYSNGRLHCENSDYYLRKIN